MESLKKVNRQIKWNHTQELKYRKTHLPRFGFEDRRNTLPETKAMRAPMLTQKIAKISLCQQAFEKKQAAIEDSQRKAEKIATAAELLNGCKQSQRTQIEEI